MAKALKTVNKRSTESGLPKAGTPLMRQYLDIKQQYPETIVLFRMGDFFETFNEDAEITARILGIVLTKRANGAAADVPLAGFPHHALDNYLPKLVNAGHRVAICEQVEDPREAKGIVKREVVEVVTPGTLTTDHALSKKQNQFLASLSFQDNRAGYAILDQSTGEFYLGEIPAANLTEALRKFAPREVIVAEKITYSTTEWYRGLKPFITTVENWVYSYDQAYRTLTDHFGTASLKGFGCEDLPLGITAAGAIFHHVQQSLNGELKHVSTLHPIRDEGVMGLDGFTVRNLELFQSLATQGTHGTLLEILDDTLTAGGGRLLKRWLARPLTDHAVLNDRLDRVEALVEKKRIHRKIRDRLKDIVDIERVVGKINRGSVSPREIMALADSLAAVPELKRILSQSETVPLQTFNDHWAESGEIIDRIRTTLSDDPPNQLGQGNVIRPGVDTELDELRTLVSGGKDWITRLQETERERTGIPSLKVGYNKVFGYYLEITKAHQSKVPDTYIRKQTLVNAERYITPELKEYEEKILTAEEEIGDIEIRLFQGLCDAILKHVQAIQQNAQRLARLDVLASFASLARREKYQRPTLVEEPVVSINEGRHPVVEKLLPATDRFIPNDLDLDADKSQIHLITGPNMAGKSTYLRQVGLIVLMAQIGSFVPASDATIGMVDKLFTRVGASDNLAGGESTFLVEMNEAANILNNATEKSLILLDEIGRGTATFDGLSLAWAITEYLHETPNVAARTLFATHYHELTDLADQLARVENHHVAVKEYEDKIVFLRKIVPGPGDKSYGIHVARMAGLPTSILRRATEILNYHLTHNDPEEMGTIPAQGTSRQIQMFEEEEHQQLKQSIQELDINNLTPLQALKALDELKRKHGL